MRKVTKKCCELCGDIFITTAYAARYCPSCSEFRRRYRGYTAEGKRGKKLCGNEAIIEKINIEAAEQGVSYGRFVGKRYAEKYVRVARKDGGRK